MSSIASSPRVRAQMQAQRVRDTAPEVALRRLLHASGLRYRVDRAPIAGLRRRADLVFATPRVAVFVDGCFWHACPTHGSLPVANREWWAQKLERTRTRDAETDQLLNEAGWTVLRVWEHEDVEEAAERIVATIRAGRRHLASR